MSREFRSNFWLGLFGAGIIWGVIGTLSLSIAHEVGWAITNWVLTLLNLNLFIRELRLPQKEDENAS